MTRSNNKGTHLRETAVMFEQGEVDFHKRLRKEKTRAVLKAIKETEVAQDRPKLKRLW